MWLPMTNVQLLRTQVVEFLELLHHDVFESCGLCSQIISQCCPSDFEVTCLGRDQRLIARVVAVSSVVSHEFSRAR